MNIKIQETGKIEELNTIDSESGTNWTADLIGNAGAISDGQFEWSEEDDAYLASQDTFDWWNKYIADMETTQTEVENLADDLNIDASIIRQRVEAETGSDYEMHRHEAIQAMKEIEEEYA